MHYENNKARLWVRGDPGEADPIFFGRKIDGTA
jgi:hypothetical protein